MRAPTGGRIVALAALLNAALVALAAALEGGSEEGVRLVVRHTAKLAVVFFCAAFMASSLQTLRPSAASRWMLANRRMLGLSFALSHTVHLAGLVVLQVRFPETGVLEPNPVTYLGGGGAYLVMFLMAATSWDGAVERLGRDRWRGLHTLGSWWLWIVFAQSYGGRMAVDPLHPATLFALLVLATGGLRLARWRRHRRG